MEKERCKKIVRYSLAIGGTILIGISVIYLGRKCHKLGKQITSLQAENSSLRKDRATLLSEINKRDYHLGKLMTTQILKKGS